jgi:ribosomal protein S12 methylthiotransferase accessory factor YcaO
VPARRLEDFTDRSTRDAAGDVAACRDRVGALGMDLWTLDLSRPDVDLAVAKVIVPGMRHFWRRLAPGRLYDAPVRMGWIDKPLPESALNPETVFF